MHTSSGRGGGGGKGGGFVLWGGWGGGGGKRTSVCIDGEVGRRETANKHVGRKMERRKRTREGGEEMLESGREERWRRTLDSSDASAGVAGAAAAAAPAGSSSRILPP